MKRALGVVVSVVLVVAVFAFFLPKLADYGEVWDTITDVDAAPLTALVVLSLWNLVALVPLWVVAQPGVTLAEGFVDMTAGTAAANTLPAGSAIGIGINWAMYDSWGFTPAEYTLATLVSGLWNAFVKLGLPVVALLVLALSGDLERSFVPAALVGVAVMAATIVVSAALFRSDRLASAMGERAGRLVGHFRHRPGGSRLGDDWGERAVQFRHRSVALVGSRWPALTVTALVGQLSLYLLLLVAVRVVGISSADVSWPEVLSAFAFVRLISAVPVTPGGLGVVELGLTAALASGQSTDVSNRAAAAVLLYRAATYLLPIPVGAGCYVFWRVNRSWRRTPEERAAAAVGAGG
jgi:uncharacterized membrane protein YbhN (UPF0104 family)